MTTLLDPQTRTLIQRAAEQSYPSVTTASVAEARASMAVGSKLVAPQGIEMAETRDLAIPGPGGDIAARLYRPREAEETPGAALVYFHGGGFVLGSIETHDGVCRALARAGRVRVVSIDYRLAPEHVFPAALDDADAALRWIVEQADALGIDPERVAVGGDSAGGNISATLALRLKARGGPRLKLQLLIYPVTILKGETPSMAAYASGYMLERAAMDFYADAYAQGVDQENPEASPLLAPDHSDLPPAYLVTAGHDPLRDEGAAYAVKLKAAGTPCVHVDYPGQVHGFVSMAGLIEEGMDAIEACGTALRRAFT